MTGYDFSDKIHFKSFCLDDYIVSSRRCRVKQYTQSVPARY